MKISAKKFQLVILFFTPKTTTTKILKSNSTFKPYLSFYSIDVWKVHFFVHVVFSNNFDKTIKLLWFYKAKRENKIISIRKHIRIFLFFS